MTAQPKHTEARFEDTIQLALLARGYVKGNRDLFKAEEGLFPSDMIAYIKASQPKKWVAAAPAVWFAPIHARPFLETLVLVLGGVILGPVSRIPAGILLIPMFFGAVLQSNGLVEIELPSWLLAVSYLLLCWTICFRVTQANPVYGIR